MVTSVSRQPQHDEVRRRYSELISTLLAQGDAEAAAGCARLAVEQGIWRDPAQRPVHYLPSLDPIAVHDPREFWFVEHLEQSYSLIREEVGAVLETADHGFLPVEEPLLGDGDWKQVTFYEGGRRFDDACERFPVTASLLEAIPEATVAGPGVATLSRLQPGTRIVPHCGASNAKLRVHLGVHVPDGPRMRVGDRVLRWDEGRCLVFDDSFEHEVWHDGDTPRVVLLLDVWHPQVDVAVQRLITADRGSVASRVREFMQARGIVRAEDDGERVLMEADEGVSTLIRRHLRQAGVSAVSLHDDETSAVPSGTVPADAG